ncbi:MAG: hypothetical protein ACRDHX_09815 [Chloroflexota bacterium]
MIWGPVALAGLLWLVPAITLAHGDAPRLATRAASYDVQIISRPSPVAQGGLKLTVMLEDAATQAVIRGARVDVVASAVQDPAVIRDVAAEPDTSTPVAHYVTTVLLPRRGPSQTDIDIRGPLVQPVRS